MRLDRDHGLQRRHGQDRPPCYLAGHPSLLSCVTIINAPGGFIMSKSKEGRRRGFGALIAASGAAAPALMAQQQRAAPGNFQRPLVPETPPFDAKLEFA